MHNYTFTYIQIHIYTYILLRSNKIIDSSGISTYLHGFIFKAHDLATTLSNISC